MLSTRTKKLLAVGAFSLTFLLTRIPFLGYDEINPDAVNWHFRSEQFIVALKSRDFLKTYQHYHPGVTLMWTMGTPIEVYRQINPQDRVYNEDNFMIQHQIAKYSLVLVQLILSIVLFLGLKDTMGLKKSLFAVSLFSFEPWFLGNSRLLHMDVMLSLFMVLALTFAYRYYRRGSFYSAILSGAFAGLAFLTKSVGALTIPVIMGLLLLSAFRHRVNRKRVMQALALFLVSSLSVIFMLFPALWVDPKFVLTDIYNEGLRIGTRRGHDQIILGEQAVVAGPEFYPLVLALKTSPVIWFGILSMIVIAVKNRYRLEKSDKRFLLFLTCFYLIYFIGMSLASKKLDRYMVPLFPFSGIVSSISLQQIYRKTILLVVLVAMTYPVITFYPYYFTYTNPFFGSAENANRIVGQKPFGVGIWELKNQIKSRYGPDPNLGFIDKKPMSTIYKNSRLFDIREAGTSKYDLIILGPNEEMPENVTEGRFKFLKDASVYINGLEFWRIKKV